MFSILCNSTSTSLTYAGLFPLVYCNSRLFFSANRQHGAQNLCFYPVPCKISYNNRNILDTFIIIIIIISGDSSYRNGITQENQLDFSQNYFIEICRQRLYGAHRRAVLVSHKHFQTNILTVSVA